MLKHRHLYDIFVILILVATVRGLNITRCLGPYNDSYPCPGPSDPPERTHCCLWDGQPTCCLPGGSSCSDSADIRNYCPGPKDGDDRTHCCVWDSKPACCYPGGSSCDDSRRNYCPGPNDGKNDRFCKADSRNGIIYCSRNEFVAKYLFWVILGSIAFVLVGGFLIYLAISCWNSV